MRNIILIILFGLILISCKTYIQVFNTDSLNTGVDNEFYVYENDTLKIIYSFWNEKGLMSFAVFNKLERPIFLDWKKSAYIDNSIKLNYWVDEEISKSLSYFGNYYYNGPLSKPGFAISQGVGAVVSSKTRVERITFIPPNSIYYRSQFHILPVPYYKLKSNTAYSIEQRNDRPKKKTKVYSSNFTKDSSPLLFRNFLTFSLTEDFKSEFYIDNGFYISNIKVMDKRHFEFYMRQGGGRFIKDEKGNFIYIRPHKKETSFYIHVPQGVNIEK